MRIICKSREEVLNFVQTSMQTTYWRTTMSVKILALLLVLVPVATIDVVAQEATVSPVKEEQSTGKNKANSVDPSLQEGMSKKEKCYLFLAEGLLFLVVLVGAPIYSCWIGKSRKTKIEELRGLNLPRGSIRGMLALLSIGSFLIFLVLGHNAANFSEVVTALGTLTGTMTGFYFGNRGGAKS